MALAIRIVIGCEGCMALHTHPVVAAAAEGLPSARAETDEGDMAWA